MKGIDILTMAAKDAMILGAGQTLSNDDAQDILLKANRIIDNWTADDRAIYVESFDRYVLTPNHSPHTIGPGGDFQDTVRPVTIENAELVNTSLSPAVKIPITLRDYQWYAEQVVPTLTSAIPTDLYYASSFPLGKLYLWPIPTVAYTLELWTRGQIDAITLAGTVTFPPGYLDALTLTLAENICPMFGQRVSPDLATQASAARARAFATFSPIPTLATRDSGMPNSQGRANTFRWDIGQHSSRGT